jgi:hypothetical protein
MQGLWIPGLRQVAHPQVRNCAPGNDDGMYCTVNIRNYVSKNPPSTVTTLPVM